jgi:hypothetical protein
MAEYYDYVLGLIPLTAVGVAGLLALAGVSPSLAIPVGAGLTVPLVGHALFVRAPVSGPRQPTGQSPASETTAAQQNTLTSAD